MSGTGSELVTVGGLVGLHHRFDANNGVFARSGIKWVQLDRDATVGATTLNGQADVLVGAIQAGYQRQLWENTTFDTSLFGDFGQNFSSGGGNIGLTIRF